MRTFRLTTLGLTNELVSVALGAIPGSPRLRVLTAVCDLSILLTSIFKLALYVDALAAI